MSTRKLKEYQRGASAKAVDGLTAQQQIFVKSLLASKDFSPGTAAEDAGYKHPHQTGNALLKHPVIRAAIGKELRQRKERLEWAGDDVLEGLRAVIDFDITELYDLEGDISMKKVKALSPLQRKCITEIRTKRKFYTDEDGERQYYNQIELKLMSKDQAMHLALKHFGLLNDDLHVHVMDEKVKQRIIVELLGQIAGKGNVIDAASISSAALEDLPDATIPANAK